MQNKDSFIDTIEDMKEKKFLQESELEELKDKYLKYKEQETLVQQEKRKIILKEQPSPKQNKQRVKVNPLNQRDKNITISLAIGTLFILLAGIVLSTTSWNILSNLMKTFIILSASGLFFGLSYFTEKVLKIPKTSFVFWLLGSLFIPVSLISLGFFQVLGEWFSFYGEGMYLYSLCSTAMCFPIYMYGFKRYKNSIFGYLVLSCFYLLVLFSCLCIGLSKSNAVIVWGLTILFSYSPLAKETIFKYFSSTLYSRFNLANSIVFATLTTGMGILFNQGNISLLSSLIASLIFLFIYIDSDYKEAELAFIFLFLWSVIRFISPYDNSIKILVISFVPFILCEINKNLSKSKFTNEFSIIILSILSIIQFYIIIAGSYSNLFYIFSSIMICITLYRNYYKVKEPYINYLFSTNIVILTIHLLLLIMNIITIPINVHFVICLILICFIRYTQYMKEHSSVYLLQNHIKNACWIILLIKMLFIDSFGLMSITSLIIYVLTFSEWNSCPKEVESKYLMYISPLPLVMSLGFLLSIPSMEHLSKFVLAILINGVLIFIYFVRRYYRDKDYLIYSIYGYWFSIMAFLTYFINYEYFIFAILISSIFLYETYIHRHSTQIKKKNLLSIATILYINYTVIIIICKLSQIEVLNLLTIMLFIGYGVFLINTDIYIEEKLYKFIPKFYLLTTPIYMLLMIPINTSFSYSIVMCLWLLIGTYGAYKSNRFITFIIFSCATTLNLNTFIIFHIDSQIIKVFLCLMIVATLCLLKNPFIDRIVNRFKNKWDFSLIISMHIFIQTSLHISFNNVLFSNYVVTYASALMISIMFCIVLYRATLVNKSSIWKEGFLYSLQLPLYVTIYYIEFLSGHCLELYIIIFAIMRMYNNYKFRNKEFKDNTLIINITLELLFLNMVTCISLSSSIFFGIYTIFLLLVAINKDAKKIRTTCLIWMIINLLFQTRMFWIALPWWAYLLIVGVSFISLASYNEVKKNKKP